MSALQLRRDPGTFTQVDSPQARRAASPVRADGEGFLSIPSGESETTMARKKKTLKVGIIGTGGISGVHNSGYVKSGLAEVYAICDIQPDVLAAKGEAYNVPEERRFLDHRDLLKLDEIDAVSVCTPNKSHCEITVNAFKAGKHVLCEKPMAMNPREAQKMNDAADKAGKKLQIGLMHRFRPDAGYIHDLAADGVLGDVYYARCQAIRRRGVPSWGVFGQIEEQGGGGLIDIGVHMIDLTWWLMGKPEPVSVSGQTYNTIGNTPGHFGQFGPWDWKTYTVEDFACAMVRFANGATMNIECSFVVNLDKDRMGCDIVGDKGGASLSPFQVTLEQSGHLMDCTPHHFVSVDLHGTPVKASNHELEVAAFCDCVLNDNPVLVPGTEAIWTQKIIHHIFESAQKGKEVKIK
jgi:predicted dehydrogenase